MIHEDKRRTLHDVSHDGEFWVGNKTVIAKEDCVLGKHYHKIKTELFTLVKGEIIISHRSIFAKKDVIETMKFGEKYLIRPNTIHEFRLRKGAIMNCLVNREYTPKDDFIL